MPEQMYMCAISRFLAYIAIELSVLNCLIGNAYTNFILSICDVRISVTLSEVISKHKTNQMEMIGKYVIDWSENDVYWRGR